MSLPKLSLLSETLIGSEIVRLGAEIKEKIKQGNEIYNYTIGDFDSSVFPIPKELEEEINKAYQSGYTNYPPADGLVELREAVSKLIAWKLRLEYGVNEVLIAAGGRPLIYSFYRAVVDPKDKVIYSVPSWNNNHYVHFTEGEHVVIEAKFENNFMPTADEIKPHLAGASVLALCSPLNPTGTAFRKEELEAICDLVIHENETRAEGEKKLYVLYDQIYWTLTFGDTVHYDPVSLRPAMRPYTVYIDGISKSLAATGVRVGWAIGPTEVLVKMRAINSHVGAWSPMAEQRATAKYLVKHELLEIYMTEFKSELDSRLRIIHEAFQDLKLSGFAVDSIAPQAAIYLTIKFDLVGKTTTEGSVLKDQAAVTSYILNEARLAVVPFYAFGSSHASNWYRLSIGTCKKDEIREMLTELGKALQKLK